MHTLNLTRIAGLVGLGAACGPMAPQDNDGSSGASEGTGEESGTGEPTGSGTGEPTVPTEPTSTTPPPECEFDGDCDDVYCGYCSDGMCKEGVGCCDFPGGARSGQCSPPYDCYDDEGCPPDEVCEGGLCIPVELPQLRPCPEVGVASSQWLLGATPWAFVLADLDADGDLDLAASQPSVGKIEIGLNDGLGNLLLAGAVDVGVANDGLALAAGDLDEDGDNDLAVVRSDPGGGLILLFGQDAVFMPVASLPTAPSPSAVFIRTLEDDALEDIVTISPTAVAVRRGTPGVDFSAELVAISQDQVDPRATIFDIDHNGRLDLFSKLVGTNAVAAWLGDGDGGFTPNFSVEPTLDWPVALVDDLDPQDDLPTLVFARSPGAGGQIDVWRGIDAPQMFDVPVTFFTNLPITGGALQELDTPAGPDLLAATGESSVLVALGDGVGGFACERILAVEAPTVQRLLAAGDLNGDGRADIVAGNVDSPAVTVLLSQ